jgi:hypothetical protein
MKPITIFTALLLLLTTSCHTGKKPQADLTTIDIIPALSNYKEFRLSEMIDSVEYIKLETRPECLISSASRVIGKKYILLLNGRPPQVLLFDRTGKFIRPIGKIGKGPGEYTYPDCVDLSPNEERIIVHDISQRLFMEFSVDGSLISTYPAPRITEEGSYYLDQNNIVFMQRPLSDSLHFPRIVVLNLVTREHKSLWFKDYKRNPQTDAAGYCFGNDLYRIDDGIVFKDALCDTIYRVFRDGSIKPAYGMNSFFPKAVYYCMTEQEIDALSHVNLAGFTPRFLFFIGDDKERFHMVYDVAGNTTYRLPQLKKCLGRNDYAFGIINDLDGTGPYWFWSESEIRSNVLSSQLQIYDLKEKIQADCFTKADLKTNKYRDQLKKLAEESSENDNPVIRIMHLK